jgi:hypothetical protein
MYRLKTTQTQNLSKSPEEILWYAVIAQAIRDAKYDGFRKEYLDCKQSAIIWLSRNSKDFKLVCHYAGFDSEFAYKKINNAFQKNEFTITEKQDKIINKIIQYKPQKKYKKRFKLKF